MRPRTWLWVPALAVLLAAAGCGSGGIKEDPILKLSAEESLETGKELMESKKYAKAREYLTHAFEVAPNSATGREALLLAADTHFLERGTENMIKAEAKYRDFRNRFPTSERSAYVQFQIANSLAERMLRPDRDQSASHKALEAYEEVLALYPSSEYAVQAQEQIASVRLNLAESEFIKGRFNYKLGLAKAAASRLETLLESYPEFARQDEALYLLGLSYKKVKEPEKARAAFGRLRAEHPDSPFVDKIPKVGEVKAK